MEWTAIPEKEGGMQLELKSLEREPGIVVISLAGPLDTNTYRILEDHIEAVVREGGAKFVNLDLGGVHYISSMGVRAVLKSMKTMKAQGGGLSMMNLQPQIKKVFEILHAVPSLRIFASLRELDEYLAEMQRRTVESGSKG